MKKYIYLLISALFLISCGNNTADITIDLSQSGGTTAWVPLVKKDSAILEKGIKIQKGLPENFPKFLKIYDNEKTYENSNVENYLYFVVDSQVENKEILDSFVSQLEKNNYINILEQEDPSYISYEENPSEDAEVFIEPKKININIQDTTPTLIRNNMGLEWKFIEIYYNQL